MELSYQWLFLISFNESLKFHWHHKNIKFLFSVVSKALNILAPNYFSSTFLSTSPTPGFLLQPYSQSYSLNILWTSIVFPHAVQSTCLECLFLHYITREILILWSLVLAFSFCHLTPLFSSPASVHGSCCYVVWWLVEPVAPGSWLLK